MKNTRRLWRGTGQHSQPSLVCHLYQRYCSVFRQAAVHNVRRRRHDSSCSLSSPNLHDAIGCLNDELVKVSRWLTSNCLKLNVSECHYIIFRCKNKKMHDPPILILNIEILEEKICTKFLGLMLDRNLCFQEHINYVTKKLSKYVPIMYQIRHNMPAEALTS